MAKTTEFVAGLLDLMQPLEAVSARAMFGGYGLFADGRMFALVADDELYFKADSESQTQFEQVGSQPFTYHKNGKPMNMSYWLAPEAVFDEPEVMQQWLQLAMAAAARAKR